MKFNFVLFNVKKNYINPQRENLFRFHKTLILFVSFLNLCIQALFTLFLKIECSEENSGSDFLTFNHRKKTHLISALEKLLKFYLKKQ